MDFTSLGTTLDLVGTFVFGLSGATLAVRRRLDIFGVLALSIAAALAGGLLRDALLGATPAAALQNEAYIFAALAAGFTVFFGYPLVTRLGKPVMVFDALGLGVFAVTGCRKALAFGLDPVASILLGILTAIGGGVVRDLLVAEVPRVLREEIYALAAFAGAAIVVLGGALGFADGPVTLVAVAAACILRILSVVYGLSAPRSPWS